MKRKRLPGLGELELEVMQVIWNHDSITVSDVLSELADERHHNTIMTVMNRLVSKGMLERYAIDGRTKGYRALVSREQVSEEYLRFVRQQFFGGSLSGTVAALLGSTRKSKGQTETLRALLDQLDEPDE